MTDSLNVVCLTGHLERPSTVRDTDGQAIARFTVRCEESGKDGTMFKIYVPCECYGRLAERASSWEPGTLLAIEGRLKWRSYVDAQGQKHSGLAVFAREVRVLEPASVAAE